MTLKCSQRTFTLHSVFFSEFLTVYCTYNNCLFYERFLALFTQFDSKVGSSGAHFPSCLLFNNKGSLLKIYKFRRSSIITSMILYLKDLKVL